MAWSDIPLSITNKFTIFGYGPSTGSGVDPELDEVRAWIADIWTTSADMNLSAAACTLDSLDLACSSGSAFDSNSANLINF